MSGARIAYVNILADDVEALSSFYRQLLGFAEIESHRSPIYRCLDGGGIEFGFNASKAYELLGLEDRKPSGVAPIRAYVTFEVGSDAAVEAIASGAPQLGGHVVKAPYETYYNAWQCVLEDPERNVFRINHRRGARTPFAELSDAKRAPIES